jgi:hypothetical protein
LFVDQQELHSCSWVLNTFNSLHFADWKWKNVHDAWRNQWSGSEA